MMLEHLGYPAAAQAVVGAIERFVEAGKGLTRDLGGTAGTSDVGRAIAELI
jgi:tartrate dehydrogenase/decarboxylase/D-malate dehydrogenase